MYLFVRSSTNPGPRVSRIASFIKKKGGEVAYLSPIRTGDSVVDGIARVGDLGSFDYFDGKGYLPYLMFLAITNIKTVKYLYKLRKQLKLVHFSDLESVLLGGILCKLLGIKYIYNIHDNFFQRYEFSSVLANVLKNFESLYIKASEFTLVPEEFRGAAYPKYVQNKIYVFRNFPNFNVSTERMPFSDSTIKLFYGGWISPNRNLDLYLQVASFLSQMDVTVKMLACGWGSAGYLSELQKRFYELGVEFEYLGQLKQTEAVDVLKSSDISIAYYSPDKIINLYAASNKIPEILGSNTILITNSQTEVAKRIKDYHVSLQFQDDVGETFNQLAGLIEDKNELSKLILNARRYYITNYNPKKIDEALEAVLNGYV
ncbi:MAG: hypothetical protein HWE18_02245 [Gammaproteobacteria bacterium]|nr:hypothetical protein [Gammaproteobacteria bacterium]